MTRASQKVCENAREALHDLRDGARIMSGGFGLCGIAENCIDEIHRLGVKDLTIISNNCGNAGMGLAVLLKGRQVKRCVCTYVGGNPDLEEQILKGEVEVEFNPQGTFVERIRAGGHGIPAFYTPTGVGTVVAEGKELRDIDGVTCLLETALTADFAIVKARYGDTEGNLVFHETARNFSPLMATAARVTIAEVEHLVPAGEIDPNHVHTPGIFVKRIFQGRDYKNTIEKLKLREE